MLAVDEDSAPVDRVERARNVVMRGIDGSGRGLGEKLVIAGEIPDPVAVIVVGRGVDIEGARRRRLERHERIEPRRRVRPAAIRDREQIAGRIVNFEIGIGERDAVAFRARNAADIGILTELVGLAGRQRDREPVIVAGRVACRYDVVAVDHQRAGGVLVGRIDVDEGVRAGDVPGQFDRLVIAGKPRVVDRERGGELVERHAGEGQPLAIFLDLRGQTTLRVRAHPAHDLGLPLISMVEWRGWRIQSEALLGCESAIERRQPDDRARSARAGQKEGRTKASPENRCSQSDNRFKPLPRLGGPCRRANPNPPLSKRFRQR